MAGGLILYVENCPEDVELAELMFKQLRVGNPLRFVRSGVEAMDYLFGRAQFLDREKHPFPGIVLLDISMPELDGFEVLGLIREEEAFQNLPVFMFSNFNEPEDHERAKQLGADGYMAKTASYKSFAAWLEDVNTRLHATKHPEAVIQFGKE
ncbi:MAG TPA: response regulator [Candidatus Cybelea sp.]|jgi:CheY-like chemotaxis protein|nr:response regulator [Candidatus Cybelea sp.]